MKLQFLSVAAVALMAAPMLNAPLRLRALAHGRRWVSAGAVST